MLMQNSRPIAYYSQVLGLRNRMKPIYEKELMAIVFAVKKWRHYLLGKHFIIRTDQQSLKFLLEQREIGSDYQKWVCKLLGFDFEIQYKKGVSNRVADALSCKDVSDPVLSSLTSNVFFPMDQIYGEIEQDDFIQQLISRISDPNSKIHGVPNQRWSFVL